ncbi:hypothetical protein [Azospirillum sp. TSO22-1]|uniref:hypothetical protein n=1 Tax=Azospirillum sp. TSO22-1 TaxID=716789 RepID=UPI000D606839|nr:hypothetical protein [Azospirillum sp. TSO22-1]PWC56031.1 hypothetical protein TSO221_02985 [Azospirillum sp. TSO22-1]
MTNPPPPPAPAPVVEPPAATPTPTPTPTPAEPDPAAVEKAAEAAIQRRPRSRSGTVATSWRGVLNPDAVVPGRKRLLGE